MTMIEQVARAMACHPDAGNITPGSTLLTPAEIAKWSGLARAAIEALRKPTEEMVRMGMTALPNSTPGRHQTTGWVWDAMIEAALWEQP